MNTFPEAELSEALGVALEASSAIREADRQIVAAAMQAAKDSFERSKTILKAMGSSETYAKKISGLRERANVLAEALSLNDLQFLSNPDIRKQLVLRVEELASDIDSIINNEANRTHKQPNRADLINKLIARSSFTRYLEIGCNTNETFNQIEVQNKVGVDPVSGGTLRMTSDAFFAQNTESFEIIFVDGLHEAYQAELDIRNSLKVLAPGGVIVAHDCSPKFEIRQIVPVCTGVWNGDVWKAFLKLRQDPDLRCAVVDIDHG